MLCARLAGTAQAMDACVCVYASTRCRALSQLGLWEGECYGSLKVNRELASMA